MSDTNNDWASRRISELESSLAAAMKLLERIDKIQPKALGGDIRSFIKGPSPCQANGSLIHGEWIKP